MHQRWGDLTQYVTAFYFSAHNGDGELRRVEMLIFHARYNFLAAYRPPKHCYIFVITPVIMSRCKFIQ